MKHLSSQQTITIDQQSFPYGEFIIQSNLKGASIELADKYIKNYSDPQKAAKYMLHISSIESIGSCFSDILPSENESNSAKYGMGVVFVLRQLVLCLAIAYLAGFDISDDEVRVFILGNFHTVPIDTGADEELSERIGCTIAHGTNNFISSEIMGHRAYKYFFENKRNHKRYRKFL